ncbi:MAG: hypothetical protein JWQ19_2260 [Subtercola sp.]|nr:hypothetical protein [Subtercola sp.]
MSRALRGVDDHPLPVTVQNSLFADAQGLGLIEF